MRTTSEVIEAAWIRIQEEFLDHPVARITSEQVGLRTGITSPVCEAVLHGLLESGVIEATAAGYRLATHQQLAA